MELGVTTGRFKVGEHLDLGPQEYYFDAECLECVLLFDWEALEDVVLDGFLFNWGDWQSLILPTISEDWMSTL